MSIEDPQDVPEAWRPHFARRRIEFTFRDLDRATEGVALNTIRRALLGIGDPSKRVVGAISDALGITPDEFLATRSTVTGEQPTTSFVLPARADQLNRRERDAVLSIVNALLDARDRHAEQPATDTADPTAAARAQGTEDQKNLVHATDVDSGSDPEGQAADDARPNVWRDKPDDLSALRSRREVLPERPEDAIAARTRDPKFGPEDEGADGIGEENQDTDWDE